MNYKAKKMMIGIYWCPPVEDKYYETIRDFGADLVFLDQKIGDIGAEQYNKAIALCGKYGFKSLVQDSRHRIKTKEDAQAYYDYLTLHADEYTKINGFYGFAYDEPNYESMSYFPPMLEKLSKKYPDALIYVNLAAKYDNYTGTTIEKISYEQYLTEYCERCLSVIKCKKILSIDYYPLLNIGEFGHSLQPEFLQVIETMTNIAKKYRVETHYYLQSINMLQLAVGLKEPNYNTLSLQAYSYLAFGADHLSHFLYYLPNNKLENNSMLTKDGVKTQMYYNAQKLNMELLKFADERLPFEFQAIMPLLGKSGKENYVFDNIKNPSKNLNGMKVVENNVDCFITELFDGRKKAYYIVNFNDKDIEKTEMEFKLNISIEFDNGISTLYFHGEKFKMSEYFSLEGYSCEFSYNENVLSVKGLEAGQGIFLI